MGGTAIKTATTGARLTPDGPNGDRTPNGNSSNGSNGNPLFGLLIRLKKIWKPGWEVQNEGEDFCRSVKRNERVVVADPLKVEVGKKFKPSTNNLRMIDFLIESAKKNLK